MKNLIFILLITVFSLSTNAQTQTYRGTDLRGKILRFSPQYNSQVPLQNAQVDLWQWRWTGYYYQNGQPIWQWFMIAQTKTDAYGFYFFYAIAPNNYTIKVNNVKDYSIQVNWIDYAIYRFQDISILYF